MGEFYSVPRQHPPRESAEPTSSEFSIGRARYARGQMIVRPTKSASGMKSRASRLAEALHARWSNREGGYIMSPSKAAKLEKFMAEGRDASLKFTSVYSGRYELDE